MITHELRQLVEASPVKPFRLHLADGRKLDVPHPAAIVERPEGVTEWVNLPIVVSVETLADSHAA